MVQDKNTVIDVSEYPVFIDDSSGLVDDSKLPVLSEEFKLKVAREIDDLLSGLG